MKKLAFTILFAVATATSFAQSSIEDDLKYDPAIHNTIMGEFQEHYNVQDDDGIDAMFSDSWRIPAFSDPRVQAQAKKFPWPQDRIWAKGECVSLARSYGKLLSFKYIGTDDRDDTIVYKVEFEYGTRPLTISVDKEHKLGTFRFSSSKKIRQLMREDRKAVARL